MRIISGKWKGHPLVAFKADHIRPTTDRVKETMFNIIQFQLDGARVLDLFCGTGNLGLEALSRGAKHCTFVEKNSKSIQITRENLIKLKVEKSEHVVLQKDVLSFLKTYEGEAFDLIFCDPPFTQKMAHEVMQVMDKSKAFGGHTTMMIESAAQERIDEQYDTLLRTNFREYGDKILSFFEKNEQNKL